MTVTTGKRDQILRPRSVRKPLQPINSPATPVNTNTTPNPKPKQERIDKSENQIQSLNPNPNPNRIPSAGDLNKENQNHLITNIESLDASLADELSAIRKKLEKMRLDKERTEKKLNEREMIMDVQMKEIQHRGDIQKMLEIELDRLYRLKELKCYCMRVSSIRSLRVKEQEKKISEAIKANTQEMMNASDDEESVGENIFPSPCSSSSEIISLEEK